MKSDNAPTTRKFARNRVFARYFGAYMFVILVCIGILAMSMLYFSLQYFRTERRSTLRAVSGAAAQAVSDNFDMNGGSFISIPDVEYGFSLISDSSGAVVFYADNYGAVRFCSEGEGCSHTDKVLSAETISDVMKKGFYSNLGTKPNVFEGTDGGLIYAVPVITKHSQLIGIVVAQLPLQAMYTYISDVINMFMTANVVVILTALIIIYYSTERIVYPLQEISNAAVRFAQGDYSARVKVQKEDDLNNIGVVLNNMAELIEQNERRRTNFIGDVSHELRTPMTTIQGYVDGMLDGTIPRRRRDHYLVIVSEEVKRLSRLITSLLEASRVGVEESAELSVHNVWDVILDALVGFEQRIEAKNIKIVMKPKRADVLCNPDMLYQVVYNLVDNAVKFTDEGGVITIAVTQREKFVFTSVRNTGKGISEEEIPRIFDRFYKGDRSRGLDKSGTGLGLYIARAAVHRMGGDMSVKSRENEYCEFEFSLVAANEGFVTKALKAPFRMKLAKDNKGNSDGQQ